ncbi:MAG: hypothetical protein ACE148_12810 [Vicinamibacterales bacterium]
MKRRVRVLTILVSAVVLASAAASAQVATEGIGPSQEKLQYQARVAAALQNRAAVEQAIVQKWAAVAEDGGVELATALSRLSIDRLLLAEDAQNHDDLNAAIFGPISDDPLSIGSSSTDLVFFPVTPCRIFDTRVAGGILTPGTPRAFEVAPGPFTAQGGSSTTCGMPSVDPEAVAITLTVVGGTATGNLRAWPYYYSAPNASVANWTASSGPAIANTTIVRIHQCSICNAELYVQADGNSVHVVGDVVGYFWSPSQTAVEQTIVETSQAIASGSNFLVASPACPSGTRLTSGGWRASIFGQPATLATSKPTNSAYDDPSGTNGSDRWMVQGTSTAGFTMYVWGVCVAVPGR